MGNAERVLFPLANLMVFGLSVYWAIPVVHGTIRALFGAKDDLVMAVATVTSAATATSAAVASESVAAVTGEKEGGDVTESYQWFGS